MNAVTVKAKPSSSPEKSPVVCDALVIGGGPAGSAISTLLAERGWNIHVLEKDSHPRFHIGESLLPQSVPMLDQLGILPEIERIGIRKYGAELISHYEKRSRVFYFGRAIDESQQFAYEVKRDEFDAILLRNAKAKGAHVHEGVQAQQVEFHPGKPSIVYAKDRAGNSRTWETKFVVDASGRDTFLSGQLGGKSRNPDHKSAAIFGHFEGVPQTPGKDAGNIAVAWHDHGWSWIIPFKDGTASVGVVCWPEYIRSKDTPLEDFFMQTINLSPTFAERMRHAKPISPVYAAANFSYQRETMSGEGYLIVGDAFTFIDPMFSSGVHLALNSAFRGAEVVDAFLKQAPDYRQHIQTFEASVHRGLKTFSWFIHRFTQPAFREMFTSQNPPRFIEKGVLSLLAGDVFGKSSTFLPLLFFKVVYYFHYLTNWKENHAATRRRKQAMASAVTNLKDYAVDQKP